MPSGTGPCVECGPVSGQVMDLEQNSFRTSLISQIQSMLSSDSSADRSVQGSVTSGPIAGTRQFPNGIRNQERVLCKLSGFLPYVSFFFRLPWR